MRSITEAPYELANAVREFFPEDQWDHACSVAFLESGWDPFAVRDTRDSAHPCGAELAPIDGVRISAELSVGWFQINACAFPSWEWQRLYNTRHNVGTAHLLWDRAGSSWSPWFFSARQLGLL
jgi:hypothetical protein